MDLQAERNEMTTKLPPGVSLGDDDEDDVLSDSDWAHPRDEESNGREGSHHDESGGDTVPRGRRKSGRRTDSAR